MSYSDGKSHAGDGIISSVAFGVGDAVYMLCVAIMFSLFVYCTNNGDFRMFMAVGAAIGCAAYHVSLGRLVMLVSGTVASAIRIAIKYVIVIPSVFIVKCCRTALAFVWRNTVGRGVRAADGLIRSAKTEKIRKKIKNDIRFSDT